MKYKYYGTAAAEGIPALWCECDVCKKARELGGRNIMSRSQSVIDDKILIDFSADTFMHTIKGLRLTDIHTCIITHAHADHLYSEDFAMRAKYFATIKDNTPLTIYAPATGVKMIYDRFAEQNLNIAFERVNVKEFTPFKSFIAEGYKITPLTADHSKDMGSVFFLIEKDKKCVLHANDTGYFPEEVWEYLEKEHIHIDFASFDCTEPAVYEDGDKKTNHMNIPTVLNVRRRLESMRVIDNNTICAVNHFSHNGHMVYDEISELAQKYNMMTSYDGLEVVF